MEIPLQFESVQVRGLETVGSRLGPYRGSFKNLERNVKRGKLLGRPLEVAMLSKR